MIWVIGVAVVLVVLISLEALKAVASKKGDRSKALPADDLATHVPDASEDQPSFSVDLTAHSEKPSEPAIAKKAVGDTQGAAQGDRQVIRPVPNDDKYAFDVVGESHYQRALSLIAGPKEDWGKAFECTAKIIREPNNKYDQNACAVRIDGKKVGYIPRADNKWLVREFGDSAFPMDVPAIIVGGWRGEGSEGDYGVRLELPPISPPADKHERALVRYVEGRAPADLTKSQLKRKQRQWGRELNERPAQWEHLRDITEYLQSADGRSEFSIKKPTAKAVREAFEVLLSEGLQVDGFGAAEVASKLIAGTAKLAETNTIPEAVAGQEEKQANKAPAKERRAELMKSSRYVSVDVETANYSYDSICQIGAALFEHGELTAEWSTLVNPEDSFASFHVGLHGIDEEMVKEAPTFPDALEQFKAFAGGDLIVSYGHFDRAAFRQACEKHAVGALDNLWVNLHSVVRRAWPDRYSRSGFGLAEVSEFLGVSLENHHNAIDDARAAGQIFALACLEADVAAMEWLDVVRRRVAADARVTIKDMAVNADGFLFGESVAFTGALSMTRVAAAQFAAELGCTPQAGVTKKTTILVVGEQEFHKLGGHEKSSKLRRAEELNASGSEIRIVGEADFMRMINLEEKI